MLGKAVNIKMVRLWMLRVSIWHQNKVINEENKIIQRKHWVEGDDFVLLYKRFENGKFKC